MQDPDRMVRRLAGDDDDQRREATAKGKTLEKRSFRGYRPAAALPIMRSILFGGVGVMSLVLSFGFAASIGQRGQSDSGSALAAGISFVVAVICAFFALRRRPHGQRGVDVVGARLDTAGLPERAQRAAHALQEATGLVEELQAELDARTALLDDVRRQVEETSLRASEMQKLARVDAETSNIINKYFDEALTSRLETLEQAARRREWLLGTLGALIFGITAILLAHYLFGF